MCRSILIENEELRQQVSQLMDRIHFLEKALADASDGESEWRNTQPHPHLNEMLSAHRSGEPAILPHYEHDRQGEPDGPATGRDDDLDELEHSLGTLIIDERGQERWLGPTATSEAYIPVIKHIPLATLSEKLIENRTPKRT